MSKNSVMEFTFAPIFFVRNIIFQENLPIFALFENNIDNKSAYNKFCAKQYTILMTTDADHN